MSHSFLILASNPLTWVIILPAVAVIPNFRQVNWHKIAELVDIDFFTHSFQNFANRTGKNPLSSRWFGSSTLIDFFQFWKKERNSELVILPVIWSFRYSFQTVDSKLFPSSVLQIFSHTRSVICLHTTWPRSFRSPQSLVSSAFSCQISPTVVNPNKATLFFFGNRVKFGVTTVSTKNITWTT